MELTQTLDRLAAVAPADFGRKVHVARGQARAAVLGAQHALAQRLMAGEEVRPTEAEAREIRRRITALYEADYDAARDGLYPEALLHDFSWKRLVKLAPALLRDLPAVHRRSHENRWNEVPDEARRYPAYYRRTFHFQTDGYFSARSAELYDAEVELLFGGSANAMRRQLLPPLVKALRGREPADVRILDVACGTGTFLGMVASALPGAALYGVDLSPYYVAHARKALAHVKTLSLAVENAESLPFRDGLFDAVTSVFLFHELPPAARSNVLREAARVLAPGGLFVLGDSLQLADAPALRRQLEGFPERYHEPFYRHWLSDDLRGRLDDAGFEIRGEKQAFLTKIVTCRRR